MHETFLALAARVAAGVLTLQAAADELAVIDLVQRGLDQPTAHQIGESVDAATRALGLATKDGEVRIEYSPFFNAERDNEPDKQHRDQMVVIENGVMALASRRHHAREQAVRLLRLGVSREDVARFLHIPAEDLPSDHPQPAEELVSP